MSPLLFLSAVLTRADSVCQLVQAHLARVTHFVFGDMTTNAEFRGTTITRFANIDKELVSDQSVACFRRPCEPRKSGAGQGYRFCSEEDGLAECNDAEPELSDTLVGRSFLRM